MNKHLAMPLGLIIGIFIIGSAASYYPSLTVENPNGLQTDGGHIPPGGLCHPGLGFKSKPTGNLNHSREPIYKITQAGKGPYSVNCIVGTLVSGV